MITIFKFFIYLLACLLLSALLLPISYPVFETISQVNPDRLLYRLGLFFCLIGLPFFLKNQNLLTRESFGFTKTSRPTYLIFFQSFFIGCFILIGLIGFFIIIGVRVYVSPETFDISKILVILLIALLSGIAVGLIEEIFFRGVMQTGARQTLNFWSAAIMISLFYSMVHFMRPSAPSSEDISLIESFSMLFNGLNGFERIIENFDRFIGLVVAGIFLSMIRERMKSVLWAIGIHAGWVATIKISKEFTILQNEASANFLVGADGIVGLASAIWIAIIATTFWVLTRTKDSS